MSQSTHDAITLTFSEDLSDDNLKLFRFPDEIMRQIEQSAEPLRLVMKAGTAQDQILLCTDDRTYSVTKMETSNTILLMQDEHGSFHGSPQRIGDGNGDDNRGGGGGGEVLVSGMVFCHYDVLPTIPRLSQLRELLKHSYYSGEIDDDDDDDDGVGTMIETDTKIPVESDQHDNIELSARGHITDTPAFSKFRSTQLYSLDMLGRSLQASRREILQALRKMHAIKVNGYWRLIEPSVMADILDVILATVASEKYQSSDAGSDRDTNADVVAHVPWRKCADGLNYDTRLVRHCLFAFSVDDEHGDLSAEECRQDIEIYKLSFKKIAIYRAQQLLEERQQQRNKSEYGVPLFLQRWKESMSQLLPDSGDPSHPWNEMVSDVNILKVCILCISY